MMRRSVHSRLRFGFSALAVFAGLVVATGADTVVVVVTAGAGAAAGTGANDTAGGRSAYFGASAATGTSLTCEAGVAIGAACGAADCPAIPDSERLRSPAWADAEARTMAATRTILRM